MSEETKPTGPCAPYGPFSTFETALNHLAALKGIPPKIDRSVFPSMGGDAKTHVLNAFRFFGLTDDKGNPQPLLSELALNKEARKQTLRQILKERYSNVSEADLGTMTIPQLDTKLGDNAYNVSGGTRQKARSFLIKAAEFAGIPLSGLLTSKGPRGPRKKKNGSTPKDGVKSLQKDAGDNPHAHMLPKLSLDFMRVPIAIAPDLVVYIDLPKSFDDNGGKNARKLIQMIKIAFDVEAQI